MRTIRKELKTSVNSIDILNTLPDNMPDNNLTRKQIDIVDTFYYMYIGKNIDNLDWSQPMYKVEMKENWPSGPRMKAHQAKRIVLNNLIDINRRGNLTNIEAANMFHSCLTCRPMYAKLVYECYKG